MSTTFTATFTVSDDNAHEELTEILELIADQLNMNQHGYAGAAITQTVRDTRGNIVGSWGLS